MRAPPARWPPCRGWRLPVARTALPPSASCTFPRDHGAHPDLRTEWWYITGQLRAGERSSASRSPSSARGSTRRRGCGRASPPGSCCSRMPPSPTCRAASSGTTSASRARASASREAAPGDARLRLRDWSLGREGEPATRAQLPAGDFALDLRCAPTQPVLLQGRAGPVAQGPEAAQASYYYSLPQLAVHGRADAAGPPLRGARARPGWTTNGARRCCIREAVGWDWIGMNLDDGSALTAFRLRRKDGSALWDGGSFRSAGGALYIVSPGEMEFAPQRRWTSPLSQRDAIRWSGSCARRPTSTPCARVVDNQELDSRARPARSTGKGCRS